MSARRAPFRGDLDQSPRSGKEPAQNGAQAHAARVPGVAPTSQGGEGPEPWMQAILVPGPRTRTQLGRRRGVQSDADTRATRVLLSAASLLLFAGIALVLVGHDRVAAYAFALAFVAAKFSAWVTR